MCEQHSFHYMHLLFGGLTNVHEREGAFATHEPYLDADIIEKESVLEEEVDV